MYRNCSTGLWIPPTGKFIDGVHDQTNCIKDKFSGQLFCFCQTNLCNGNNTGSLAINGTLTHTLDIKLNIKHFLFTFKILMNALGMWKHLF